MRLDLNDDFVIESDEYQYILKRKTFIQSGDNKGKPIENVVGYFMSFAQMAKKLLSMEIDDQEVIDSLHHVEEIVNRRSLELAKTIKIAVKQIEKQ